MILKLKRTPGIYLVGFMGAGKTTVGRLLADELGWYFVDLDQEIEQDQGTPIARLFDERGEAAFREIETGVVRKRVRTVQSGRPTVLALGGGTFVPEVNYELLEENGITIWLDCPLELIRGRIGVAEDRPLARDPVRFEQLYEERREAYARADFRIDIASDDAQAVVAAILALPIF